MKKQSSTSQSGPVRRSLSEGGFLGLRVLVAVLLCTGVACLLVAGTSPATPGKLAFLRREAPANASQRTLTFAERVSYQRAIEEVYWRHRVWPKETPDPKPSLDAVMTQAELEKKVGDYLRNSQALEDYWQRPITAEQVQAEMDRMATHTRQPEVLRELFDALGNDPFVIAECLARPILAQRLAAHFTNELVKHTSRSRQIIAATANYNLPTISDTPAGCIDDTWTTTSTTNAPNGRSNQTAVWTGSEMIVWGGFAGGFLNTGGRYDPSTDSWSATNTSNAPTARLVHTAVWTGTEMIVWGGVTGNALNTGGRYNPVTDSWTATSTINAPDARASHTAVWTGSEMIVWGGGTGGGNAFNTGGRYNPGTDSWTATSTANAPTARVLHTAVWTGSKMIVWGGEDGNLIVLNTGGTYNPGTDSWLPTNTANAPSAREIHTAIWSGSEMIVWGGYDITNYLNTGGRYDPSSDDWAATSTTNPPDDRALHTAVWTGNEMIVWGGFSNLNYFNTGGRYNPSKNTWTVTSTINAPDARYIHTAVWTGGEMIVWGGTDDISNFNTGGRYCAQSVPAQLGNISTRAFVQTGDDVMIGGFIITGAGQKRVIVRAIGPSLVNYGITNPLQNPTLELHDHTGAVIASNNNWMDAPNKQEIIDSGLAPSNTFESAILMSLNPGNYTAIVRGVNNRTGIGLVEGYDLDPTATSKLGNISTRALVQTGDNVMIGGFIINGAGQKKVIVRAIGPSLAQYGITNPLLDPTLELHDGNGAVIAFNENWKDGQQAEIQATGLAPGDDRESAIVRTLAPGSYTAIVRGKDNTIGIALVEVYGLN